VAIFAESDRDSLHVRYADEAVSLGEGSASDTYLNIEKVLQIARDTDAEAIHPGYGFLSENAHFAEACESQGLIFLGPRSEHIIDLA
jgi:urea carboxylase